MKRKQTTREIEQLKQRVDFLETLVARLSGVGPDTFRVSDPVYPVNPWPQWPQPTITTTTTATPKDVS